MLQSKFISLLNKYSDNPEYNQYCWEEIEKNYAAKNRYYHTLDHIKHMIVELEAIKSSIKKWDTILFSVFYHDIIYKVTKSDNEQQSAEVLKSRLAETSFEEIEICCDQILSSKKHELNSSADTNSFLDTDLSILGKEWPAYEKYTKEVRKEYGIYPNFIYRKGRKKVIQHFLGMQYIFKTDHFRRLYENKAKENLRKELELL